MPADREQPRGPEGDCLELHVFEDTSLVYEQALSGAVELGRQQEGEAGPFYTKLEDGYWRIIIAPGQEKSISRKSVLIEPLGRGTVRISNESTNMSLTVGEATELDPHAPSAPPFSCEVPLPAQVAFGPFTVYIIPIQRLATATAPPGSIRLPEAPLPPWAPEGADQQKVFLDWLHAAMDVLQSAASSADFFNEAARATAELICLDSARILLRKDDGWHNQVERTSSHGIPGGPWKPSQGILARLLCEKRTFWGAPERFSTLVPSLRGISAVVAAPILDRHGEVIGALYGQRQSHSALASLGPISELEASLMELFARGVAAGLARLDQERETLEARVRFEQFFTPELARHLERNRDLLQGQDIEVSLLFCDIRSFSRISERLGPARTVAWIGDTMATLSECVLSHQGVLVDYIGDELIAMWGAPEAQADHARLACRAALAMLQRLPELDGRWMRELKESMHFGIGINTGVARVGNMGSPHKFKYGPLGNAVNLASRVQGATKYLKCPLLITGATQVRLDDSFVTRRLARVRVVNIREAVDLYELLPRDRPNWLEAKTEYEKALQLFEAKKFRATAHVLGNWRVREPEDGPALVLQHRAIQCEVEEPNPFDPVWALPGK